MVSDAVSRSLELTCAQDLSDIAGGLVEIFGYTV
jgi:hypothetical protein